MIDKEAILSRLTVYDVYGEDGLKRSTTGFVMRCPLPTHNEKTASFHVRDDMGFYCFGCKEHGDAFAFIMQRDGIGFMDAVKYLADKAGVDVDTSSNGNGRFGRLCRLNDEAMKLWEADMKTNKIAQDYFTKVRGLNNDSMARFHVGFTKTSLVSALKAKGFTENEMESVGLITKKEGGGYRDFFYRRIMIPVMSGGKVKGFGGRLFVKRDEEAGMPKYLNTKDTLLFHKGKTLFGLDSNAIKKKGYAIVVEGHLDVIQLHQHGFKNAVATCGTALTKEHVEILRKHCDDIYLVFDGDTAGEVAAMKSTELLFDKWMSGRVVTMPQGEDPDSYLKSGKNFNEALAAGVPFGVYLAQSNAGLQPKIFASLLKRNNSMDTIEFLAHCGTGAEMRMFALFESRDIPEIWLRDEAAILTKGDVSVKQAKGYLYYFCGKRFVMKQKTKADGDARAQAEIMADKIIKLRGDWKQKAVKK